MNSMGRGGVVRKKSLDLRPSITATTNAVRVVRERGDVKRGRKFILRTEEKPGKVTSKKKSKTTAPVSSRRGKPQSFFSQIETNLHRSFHDSPGGGKGKKRPEISFLVKGGISKSRGFSEKTPGPRKARQVKSQVGP